MARGWGSKAVEDQIQAAATETRLPGPNGPDPAQLQRIREKENLLLSRRRVIRELETSRNERYRKILRSALADLDVKLSKLV
jgi:hypothetical protein